MYLSCSVLIAAGPGLLLAQAHLGSERRDFATVTGDIWSAWTSPARLDGHATVAAAIATGSVALAAHFDSSTRVWLNHHERSPLLRVLAPLRDSSGTHAGSLGTGAYLLPLTGVLYVGGRLSHSPGLRDAGLGCAAGDLASLGFREVAYHAVGRARPRITADPLLVSVPGSGNWLFHSFFSGHIANSMACASFLGRRYSFGIAEALPYTYSIAVGLGRMADGEHWTSDTLIGGIVGFAVGRAIAERQLTRARGATPVAIPARTRSAPRLPLVSWTVQF
jgi:membrane-associated phospholipid phosphatase